MLALPAVPVLAAGSQQPDSIQEAQAAFARKQYDRALALVEPLTKQGSGPLEAQRLQIRSLVRLGRPPEAFREYERLEARAGKDDVPLLREVAFAFILAVLKDMREQMRGAGYTALKEIDADDTIPYFEDGLSDGSAWCERWPLRG